MCSSVYLLLLWFTTCACLTFNHKTGDNYKLCEEGSNCVKKCCPEKHILKKKVCVLSEKSEFSFEVYEKTNRASENITFNVIHDYNTNCKGKKNLKLSPLSNEIDEFYVQSDGSLYKPLDNVSTFVKFTEYCLETFVLPNRQEFSALVCYGVEKLEKVDEFCYIEYWIGKRYIIQDEIRIQYVPTLTVSSSHPFR